MESPLFDGMDAQSWVTHIQYYFDHIMLQEEHRLHYVVMLFSPPASDWVFSYRANNQHASWSQFLEDVHRRFDPHYFVDYVELLAKLTQSGSLVDYHREFEAMLNRVQGLPESTLLPIYLGGLRQPVHSQVRFQHPKSVAAAMALAMEFDSAAERSVVPSRRPWSGKDNRQPLLMPPSSSPTGDWAKPAVSVARPRDFSKLPVVHVSVAEKAERSRLGFFWYCSEKWVAGHSCKRNFLAYMGTEEDDIEHDDSEEPAQDSEIITTDLSHMYSMDGTPRASSLEFQGMLGNMAVVILVDTGSTHNFLHPRVAEKCQLPLRAIWPFRVYVGNGESLSCSHMSRHVEVVIQGHTFALDLYILPVHGPDLIFGLSWLRSLLRVTSDYVAGMIEFIREGKLICLKVAARSPRPVLVRAMAALMLHQESTKIFELMAVAPEADDGKIALEFPAQLPPDILRVLRDHTEVFELPKGMPPRRAFDHRIHLLPNTKPVNVQPYRYPYFQKNEIEKQVREMLDSGIIRHSHSAFSSPILLIRKKDGTFRFCIDYRALNTVTVPDHFPIPTNDELFDELGAARVFTKLDLRSGYHQIRMQEADVYKTAF